MKALIIGSDGQDGTLLLQQLENKKYTVWGVGRGVNKEKQKNYFTFDLINDDYALLKDFILQIKPDEIYYVAAFHQSSQDGSLVDFKFIENSIKVNQTGFISVLEICKTHLPKARILYTSSSLIYSGSSHRIQNETTKPEPRCIYSVAKCGAMEAANYYRSYYNLFVSVGIMYNHESILRKDFFLSKKIIIQTKQILNKEIKKIKIGNLSSITDWGYAPDYTEAMWHILQLKKPDVFIISSGVEHKVQDWIDTLFNHLNLDWRLFVVEDKSLITREKPVLIGDNTKLVSTGWTPKVSFEEMVIKMFNNVI